jgi:hypothetical protein
LINGNGALRNIAYSRDRIPRKDFTTNCKKLEDRVYCWPVRDNIAVTVGAIVITNPEHNAVNDTAYVGVVRTLFRF